MLGRLKFLTNSIFLLPLLTLGGCVAPLIIGGGAAAGMMATREKGIGGTASDSAISSKVKSNLYNFNPDLHAKVSVTVQNNEVLLTGVVQDPTWSGEAERLAKSVQDVKNVINHIETVGEESLGSLTQDGWITTRVKSSLMFEPDVYSLNYTIETCNGVVYLTGIGQNEEEIKRVATIASNVGGVKKVVNYVKVKGQEGAAAEVSSAPKTPEVTETETASEN